MSVAWVIYASHSRRRRDVSLVACINITWALAILDLGMIL